MSTSPLRTLGFASCLVASHLLASDLAAAPQPSPVTTASVQAVEWPEQVAAQGSIAAWQEASVANRVPGAAVVEIRAAVGDRVKRGTLLARLDDRALQAEQQRTEAERERARIALLQAEAEARRTEALRGSGSTSEQELLAATTTRDLARAQLQAAEASCRAIRIKLDDSRLTAPDDGLIVARSLVLGQVPAQGAELFRLIRQDRLEWRAELPPDLFARLRVGAAVQLQLPDGQTVRGRLRQLAGAIDAGSRLGMAYVDLLPGHNAKAGMLAGGRFELATRAGLAVPADAVQVRDGRAVVFRLANGLVQQIVVQTGRREGARLEVQGGLKAGERVVVQGAGFLRDGEPVREAAPVVEASKKGQP